MSPCELLGIGSKNNDGARGDEVVWKVENQAILTVSTKSVIDENRFTLLVLDQGLKPCTFSAEL